MKERGAGDGGSEEGEGAHVADAADHQRPEIGASQEADEVHRPDDAQRLAVEAFNSAAHGEQRAEQAAAEEQERDAEEERRKGKY